VSGGPEPDFRIEVVVATSIDGKISTPDRKPWRWSDRADHAWLLERMAAADLLVVGAGTLRAEDPSLRLPDALAGRRAEEGRPGQPPVLVLSPSLSVPADTRVMRREGSPVMVAARAEALEKRGGGLPGSVGRIAWEGGLEAIVGEACRRTHARDVLCLGGGRTNASFLEADLVDRISHTVSGFVIGAADAPGPFDGRGFPPERFPEFRIEETRAAGRDRILVWRRDRKAPPRTGDGGLD
jgi:5-amino-6-(5-phosphoribosylamino)uracil reductase